MRKFFVEILVDEEQLLEMSGVNNLHDALNGEFGWLRDSGIQMIDWMEVDINKNIRKTLDFARVLLYNIFVWLCLFA